jgi:hypothetical protein
MLGSKIDFHAHRAPIPRRRGYGGFVFRRQFSAWPNEIGQAAICIHDDRVQTDRPLLKHTKNR